MLPEEVFLEQIIKEEYEKLLNEFVVPVGFSLSKWKQFRKKHNTTNAQYHKKHPRRKWKVVHGHKEGHIGEPLKGMGRMSYQKATRAHAAIAMKTMNEIVEPSTTAPGTTKPKIASKAITQAKFASGQKAEFIQAYGKEGQELSGLERYLIQFIGDELRGWAATPGVDLNKVRQVLQRVLNLVYQALGPQIKASQAKNKEPEPTIAQPAQSGQIGKPQANTSTITNPKSDATNFKPKVPVKLTEQTQPANTPAGTQQAAPAQGIQTFGDLKKVIDYIELKRKGNIAAPKVAQYLAGLVPGGGTAFQMVMDAKDTIGFLSSLYKADDNFTTQSGLDVLNVNDNISKIVDDKIETAFINSLYAVIEKENPNTPIGNWNATTAVQQFLSDNFEQHTIKK
jgi:hypothetical protein